MIGTMLGALTVAVIGNGLILCSYLAVPHADRRRASSSSSPSGSTSACSGPGGRPAEDRRGATWPSRRIGVHSGIGEDRARPDPGRGDGRHADARAHPARRLELVEAAVLRLARSRIAERPLDISMIGDLRMNPFLNRDNCGLLDVEGRDRGAAAISSSMAAGPSSIRPTSASAAIRRRCSGSAGEPASTSSWAPASTSSRRIPTMCKDDVGRGDRRGDRERLRRLGGRARGLRRHHRRDRRSARTSRRRRRRCCAARRAPRRLQRRAADRSICRAGSASPIACSTSSRARAATSGTPCSAT